MDFKAIGKRIQKRRLELGYTQQVLAERIDVSVDFVGSIERSTSKCSIETLAKLSKELDLNVDYLLFGINPTNCDINFSRLVDSLPQNNKQLFINLCEAIAETLK